MAIEFKHFDQTARLTTQRRPKRFQVFQITFSKYQISKNFTEHAGANFQAPYCMRGGAALSDKQK